MSGKGEKWGFGKKLDILTGRMGKRVNEWWSLKHPMDDPKGLDFAIKHQKYSGGEVESIVVIVYPSKNRFF